MGMFSLGLTVRAVKELDKTCSVPICARILGRFSRFCCKLLLYVMKIHMQGQYHLDISAVAIQKPYYSRSHPLKAQRLLSCHTIACRWIYAHHHLEIIV